MNIFKDRKFLNTEALKKSLMMRRIYNLTNKILFVSAMVFNTIMFFMMLNQGSVFFFIFGINLYFLVSFQKGRKMKVD